MSKDTAAPKRNDFKASPLRKNSRALELQGQDPRFKYQYFSTDEKHPGFIGKRLVEHEIGNNVAGYTTVAPWEVVQDANAAKTASVAVRDDQGKPVDTTRRYGRQVLCRIPVEEHAKYAQVDDAYSSAMEKSVYTPERSGDGVASISGSVSRSDSANIQDLINGQNS